MLEKKIADKIRQIRKRKGLTLSQFGQIVGLSKGLLSRIENNQVSPPIATLSKISQGLEVPIASFFEDAEQEQKRYTVTKIHDRKQVVRHGTKIGFTYYSLNHIKPPYAMHAFVMHTPSFEKEPKVLFDHPGEELVFVLKGELVLVYGKEKICLHPGDAIHFDSSEPHRAQCIGKEDCECLVVVAGEEHLKGYQTANKDQKG